MPKKPPEYYVGLYCDIQVPEHKYFYPSFYAERCRIEGVSGDCVLIRVSNRRTMKVLPDTIKAYRLGEPEKIYIEE